MTATIDDVRQELEDLAAWRSGLSDAVDTILGISSPRLSTDGRGSSTGITAARPGRVARVPQAKPLRPMSWAKMVKASWPVGSTITSKVSAVAMRSSSTLTGRTYWPSAATTVIFRPGIRTSKCVIAEPLMKRRRIFSPERNRPVQLLSDVLPFIK